MQNIINSKPAYERTLLVRKMQKDFIAQQKSNFAFKCISVVSALIFIVVYSINIA